jgi:WD40 repeat protein
MKRIVWVGKLLCPLLLMSAIPGLSPPIARMQATESVVLKRHLGIPQPSKESRKELWLAQKESQFRTIWAVSFSRDGKLLASGCDDATVKLWDVGKGSEIRTFLGHTEQVLSVSFSPTARILATGSLDNTIRLWNIDNGKLINTLAHKGAIYDLKFSPNGKILASGSYDRTIKLWNLSDYSVLRTLLGHQDGIQSVTFSPDGKLIASGDSNGSAHFPRWSRVCYGLRF